MNDKQNQNTSSAPVERRVMRLTKKLEQRDRKIEGLKKRIALLETQIATQAITMKQLPMQVEGAVQHALCNVRMIPVLGFGKDEKILEVRQVKKDDV